MFRLKQLYSQGRLVSAWTRRPAVEWYQATMYEDNYGNRWAIWVMPQQAHAQGELDYIERNGQIIWEGDLDNTADVADVKRKFPEFYEQVKSDRIL
jgi:hypothetical protein